ncbi:hypothetical protein AB0I60_04025 [Actinosynnema sp. NPDC050436]|uniref:RICIN domain-containing protein n=1 Tax=Actinosynnema sp. NPDC050436 TaxID=3155659 RepID=UPI0033F3933F
MLPSSTTATVLGRTTLPRAQLVTAYARACGLDDADTARWVEARRRPAMTSGADTAPETAPDAGTPGAVTELDPEPPGEQVRRRTWWPLVAGVAVLAAVAATVTAFVIRPGSLEDPPADGWYLLRPAHVTERGYCVGEGRERNKRTDRAPAVQRPCVLRPVHSGECVGVLGGPADVANGAELSQAACTGKADQEFLLERVERPT